jgi:ABC-2 type transport system ATP-binding protein
MTVRQLLDFCRPLYPTWDRALERTLLGAFDLPERESWRSCRGAC